MLQEQYFRMESKGVFWTFGVLIWDCAHSSSLQENLFTPRFFFGVHDLGTSHCATTFACEICALKPFLSRQWSRT